MSELRLGVLGGTFDPIHVAHLAIAADAAEQLRLDRVLFVPTGDSWQKSAVSAGEDRYRMVQLAIADNPTFVASRVDLDRPGPTYTADTLIDLHAGQPAADLFFIAGADALAGFGSWHRGAEIVGSARIIGVGRPGTQDVVSPELPADRISWIDGPGLAVSATQLRFRVAAGRSIRYLVRKPVADYITAHGLYRDLDPRR